MTRNLLFDLELLAHADYFVGTTKSGLSPIIEVRNLLCSPSDISTILNRKLSEEVVGPKASAVYTSSAFTDSTALVQGRVTTVAFKRALLWKVCSCRKSPHSCTVCQTLLQE